MASAKTKRAKTKRAKTKRTKTKRTKTKRTSTGVTLALTPSKSDEERDKKYVREKVFELIKRHIRKKIPDLQSTKDIVLEIKGSAKYAHTKNMKLMEVEKFVTDLKKEFRWREHEIDVYEFMERLFDDVQGTTSLDKPFYLATKKGTTINERGIQVDAMGRFGDHFFLVNAKTTSNPNGTYGGQAKSLKKEIENHATGSDSQVKRVMKEIKNVKDGKATTPINEGYLRPYAFDDDGKPYDIKVHPVMALKDVDPGTPYPKTLYDHENPDKIQTAKVFNWDNKFRDYYGSLTDAIGKYAMYDLLGEMGFEDEGTSLSENDDKWHTGPFSPTLAYCLKAQLDMKDGKKKKKVNTYQFVMDPTKLLKVAAVARRHRPGEQFYQRWLDPARLEKIGEHLEKGNPLPNNLVVGMTDDVMKQTKFISTKSEYQKADPDQKKLLEKLQDDIKKSKVPIQLGTLRFPSKYRSCWIIDGQHRLYGVIASDQGKPILKNPIKLPVVVFAGIKYDTMAGMFLDINVEQKAIPPDLKFDLWGDYRPETDVGVASRICKELNQGESELHWRVFYPSYKQHEEENPNDLPKAKRIPISALTDAIIHSRLTNDILVPKDKANGISEMNNPLFKRKKYGTEKSFHTAVINKVANLIEDWFDVLSEEWTGYAATNQSGQPNEEAYKGMVLYPQGCKLWIPFLKEIVAHEEKTPSRAVLATYAQRVQLFMQECMANDQVAIQYKKDSSRWANADVVIAHIASCVKTAPGRLALSSFGEKTGILSKEDKNWRVVEMAFGLYIHRKYKKTWRKMLKKSRRERIKERKVDLEKRSDYNALEMKDVKEIMGHDEKHLRTLANNFLRTPGYYGQTRSRLMESLEEGIEDVANEIQKVRWDKEPYPQNQSVINSTHIKHYLTALRQVPGGTETDLDQEDQS